MATNIIENVSYALHNNIFVTFNPGEIVFGIVNNAGYFNENSCLRFSFSDYFLVYSHIVKIIQFFADGECEKCLIKQFNDINYYWCGITVLSNNVEHKNVKIGIEVIDGCVEMIFNESEFKQQQLVL